MNLPFYIAVSHEHRRSHCPFDSDRCAERGVSFGMLAADVASKSLGICNFKLTGAASFKNRPRLSPLSHA